VRSLVRAALDRNAPDLLGNRALRRLAAPVRA